VALSEFPRLGSDPFVELRRMQSEMNRLFSGFSSSNARDFPPVNIWLGDNSVVVTAELPGVTRDDVTLGLQTMC
jgi:HSP20 family protein